MKRVPNASKQMRRLREARGGGIIVLGGLDWIGMIWVMSGEGKGKEREEKRRDGLLGHVFVLVHWRWVDG